MTTILAVDDSASMRQMVSYTLKDAGYSVVEAANGQEALTAAKTESFDLILSDLNMPVMDGITLGCRNYGAYRHSNFPGFWSPLALKKARRRLRRV